MANVFLIGLEPKAAAEIARVASAAHHTVCERSHTFDTDELSDAGIVFAGGGPQVLKSLLRRIRGAYPTLPVVAVLGTFCLPDMLDALEAGATDYCWVPIGRRPIQVMELIAARLDQLSIGRQYRVAGASGQ
jgi:hypothetical protein